MEVLTVVEGKIPESKRKTFEASYKDLRYEPIPTGLIETILLRENNNSGIYRIQGRWESQEAIELMRKIETPKAVELFKKFGVTPKLGIYEIADTFEKDILALSLEKC
jgi:quinol monooxygenase YgiN